MSSATFAKRFTYTDEGAGDDVQTRKKRFTYTDEGAGDDVQTRKKRFTYRDPLSVPPLTYTYVEVVTESRLTRLATEALSTSDPSAALSRLAVEALSTSDILAYLTRLAVEVLSPNIDAQRRRPKFFTFQID